MITGPARDPRIDALRGFALLGILLVNIQSFISGAPNALGFLPADAGLSDRVAYFITATFILGKFMPLFGMLFGAGFALLYDKLSATFEAPRRLYRRRLAFLAGFGLLHALLLYFGDITLAYAIAGFVLLLHADSDLPSLARATAGWWLFAAAWLLISILPAVGSTAADALPLIEMVERNIEAGMTLGFAAQWPLRVQMGLWQIQANLFGLPSIIALMMTGALAQRAGWLRHPDAPAWRRAALIGLGFGPAGCARVRQLGGDARRTGAEPVDSRRCAGAARDQSRTGLPVRRAVSSTRARRGWWHGSHRPAACRSRTTCCNRSRWRCCCRAGGSASERGWAMRS